MKIGKYKLFSIETSEFALDGGAMFGIIPKVMWEKKLSPDSLRKHEIGDPLSVPPSLLLLQHLY